MKRSDLIEYVIEFAWSIQDNTDISRAASRHSLVGKINDFLKENQYLPNEDIDEFVMNYINLNRP